MLSQSSWSRGPPKFTGKKFALVTGSSDTQEQSEECPHVHTVQRAPCEPSKDMRVIRQNTEIPGTGGKHIRTNRLSGESHAAGGVCAMPNVCHRVTTCSSRSFEEIADHQSDSQSYHRRSLEGSQGLSRNYNQVYTSGGNRSIDRQAKPVSRWVKKGVDNKNNMKDEVQNTIEMKVDATCQSHYDIAHEEQGTLRDSFRQNPALPIQEKYQTPNISGGSRQKLREHPQTLILMYMHSSDAAIKELFSQLSQQTTMMSPRSAAKYLQVPAKLVGLAGTPRVAGLGPPKRQDLGHFQLMHSLADRLLDCLPEVTSPTSGGRVMRLALLTPKDVALAAWSCGRVKFRHRPLLALLAWMSLGCLAEMRKKERVTGVAADNSSLEHLFSQKAKGRERAMSSSSFTVRSKHCSGSKMGRAVFDQCRLNSIDISNLLWACSRLKFHHQPLLYGLINEAAKSLEQFNAHSLASMFVALAALNLRRTGLTPDSPASTRDTECSPSCIRSPRTEGSGAHTRTCSRELSQESSVEQTLQRKLHDFDARRLCNFLWSCAKLNWKNSDVLNTALNLLIAHVEEMEPQHVANVFWSCGYLKLHRTDILDALAKYLLSRVPIREASEFQASTTSYGNEQPAKTKASLQRRGSRCARNLRYKNEGINNGQHRSKSCHLSYSQLSLQDAQGISNIFWAIGKLLYKPFGRLLEALCCQAISQCRSMLPQHISNIVWACARLRHRNVDLLSKLCYETSVKLRDFKDQNIANVYWGLGKLMYRPKDNVLIPPNDTQSEVVEILLHKFNEFKPQSISNMLLACAYLNWARTDIVKKLIKQMERFCLQATGSSMLFPAIPPVSPIGQLDGLRGDSQATNLLQGKMVDLQIHDTDNSATSQYHHPAGREPHDSYQRQRRSSWHGVMAIGTSEICNQQCEIANNHNERQVLLSETDDTNSNQSTNFVDIQHLSNICWVVGTIKRDQNVSLSDRESLPHHVFRIFAIFAGLLTSPSARTIHREATPAYRQRRTRSSLGGNGKFDKNSLDKSDSMKYLSQSQSTTSLSSPPQSHPHSTSHFKNVPLQQLSIILWGYASVRLRHDCLFKTLCQEIMDRLRSLESTVRAFWDTKQAVLGYGQLPTEENSLETARECVPAISQTIWALGRSSYPCWGLLALVVKLLIEDSQNIKTIDISATQQLLSSSDMTTNSVPAVSTFFVKVDGNKSQLLEKYEEISAAKMLYDLRNSWFWQSASIHNVANIIWGLTVLISAACEPGEPLVNVQFGAAMDCALSEHNAGDKIEIPMDIDIEAIEEGLADICLISAKLFLGYRGEGKEWNGIVESYGRSENYEGNLINPIKSPTSETSETGTCNENLNGSSSDSFRARDVPQCPAISTSYPDNRHVCPRTISSSAEHCPINCRHPSALRDIEIVMKWLGNRIELKEGRVSESHIQVEEALTNLFPIIGESTETHKDPSQQTADNNSTVLNGKRTPCQKSLEFLPPDTEVVLSRECYTEDKISCDLILRFSFGQSTKKSEQLIQSPTIIIPKGNLPKNNYHPTPDPLAAIGTITTSTTICGTTVCGVEDDLGLYTDTTKTDVTPSEYCSPASTGYHSAMSSGFDFPQYAAPDATNSPLNVSQDINQCNATLPVDDASNDSLPVNHWEQLARYRKSVTVVLEVDGPWHYNRVLGPDAMEELSPLSPDRTWKSFGKST